jgi:aspartyl-tRNA(Asn)/glutamyl-tRNA(Gln) amidotransferase subunit A
MAETPLHYLPLSELARRLRSRELTPVEITRHFLERIGKLDRRLGAFRRVLPERAMAEAEAAETAMGAGVDLGPLHGLPFAAKDLFNVKGYPTTAGSKVLEDNVAADDSTVTRKLAQAGMILLGKTNTVEFAYGGVGINHHHGTPHNPWAAKAHAPGGSSSGSAVAVASGMAPMALGTDTGGSVRIPASLCGTVGLKTTVGRISRAGVYPLSYSLDSVGPLSRTVEDAAIVYQCLQGEDPADDTTLGVARHNVLNALKAGVKGLRVAFAETAFFDEADPEVAKAVREAGAVFTGLGAHVDSIPFPEAAEAMQLNPRGLVISAEAYAVNRKWLEERFNDLDPVVGQRMIHGKSVPAHEYFAKTRRWAELRAQARETLRHVDALLVPATMIPPLPVAEIDSSMETYMTRNAQYLRNTAIGNILNLCGLALPCGFTSKGLPIGLMIYGKPFNEDTVLRIGHAYEQATQWHTRMPDLSWVGAGKGAAVRAGEPV